MLNAVIEVSSRAELALVAKKSQPDIVLLDYNLPRLNGVDAITQIHSAAPNLKMIVISAPKSLADRLVCDRALAFLSNATDAEDAIAAIKTILREQHAATVIPGASANNLTQKQFAVLKLIARGKSNKEASQQLKMAPETVKSHLSEIYRRLEVVNRAEAVNAAHQRGII